MFACIPNIHTIQKCIFQLPAAEVYMPPLKSYKSFGSDNERDGKANFLRECSTADLLIFQKEYLLWRFCRAIPTFLTLHSFCLCCLKQILCRTIRHKINIRVYIVVIHELKHPQYFDIFEFLLQPVSYWGKKMDRCLVVYLLVLPYFSFFLSLLSIY